MFVPLSTPLQAACVPLLVNYELFTEGCLFTCESLMNQLVQIEFLLDRVGLAPCALVLHKRPNAAKVLTQSENSTENFLKVLPLEEDFHECVCVSM